MLRRRWALPLLGAALIASTAAIAGCGKGESGERVAERITERTDERGTGRDTVDTTEIDVWPADVTSDVPRFVYGAVERVTRSRDGRGRTTKSVVRLCDIEDGAMGKYEVDLRRAGWQPQLAVTSERGGMVTARKGSLGVTLAYDSGTRQADLSVYTAAK